VRSRYPDWPNRAHDLSDGGLAVALAESSFGPAAVGAEIHLDSDLRPELLLFHEGPSRVLISTAEPGRIVEIAAKHAVEAVVIGSTVSGRHRDHNRSKPLIAGEIGKFRKAGRRPWRPMFDNSTTSAVSLLSMATRSGQR